MTTKRVEYYVIELHTYWENTPTTRLTSEIIHELAYKIYQDNNTFRGYFKTPTKRDLCCSQILRHVSALVTGNVTVYEQAIVDAPTAHFTDPQPKYQYNERKFY